jgi:hypothetical protein
MAGDEQPEASVQRGIEELTGMPVPDADLLDVEQFGLQDRPEQPPVDRRFVVQSV